MPSLPRRLWLLVEARVPIVVAAEAQGVGKSTLLDRAARLPATDASRLVELAGEDETFDWLPQASELGWPGVARPGGAGSDPVRPETTMLLVARAVGPPPAYTWGAAARVAVRAASIGYGLAATIHADSLDDVFDALRRRPVRLADDELSHLGVVLVATAGSMTAAAGSSPPTTSVPSHATSTAISSGSGLRSSPPGTRTTDAFEQFGWGVTPELARRVDRRAGDFEIEVERRRSYLEDARGGRDHGAGGGPRRDPRLPPGRGV